MKKEKRQELFDKHKGLCAYTGKLLGSDWQVDHMEPPFFASMYGRDANRPENLVPALKIVNHYKREQDLESFREYMMSFHLRLAKLPKKTRVDKTKRRIAYMLQVADAFGVTVDNPFCGKFYFELIAREWPCRSCLTGEMKQEGYVSPQGIVRYVCTDCGTEESYP